MNKEDLTSPVLEALLQAPSLAVSAVDKQGSVILWSPSAASMFGWTESEALGRFLPIIPQDRRQEFRDWVEKGIKGETAIVLEARRLRKDGTLIDVNLWTSPLKDSKGDTIGLLGVHADITARKRAERALQQSEAELQRVLNAVSDYLYSGEFDSDGRFFYHYYSPAVERIMGRPPLFFLTGPERWLSAVHPEDRPRLAEAFARLQTGQSTSEEEEYRIAMPDRTIRWVRDSVTLSQGPDGRRFVNGVVSDITVRKQTEEALRDSELELRRVLDAAADYFWSGDIDPEGGFRYRYFSPAVERITGRPADFYMAGPEKWMSTVHPDDRDRLAEVSEQLRSGQLVSHEYQYRIVLPDGTIRWLLSKTTVSPLLDGHRRVDGVVSDITARKQTEQALRDSELELRRVLGAASDYFWSGAIDPEGRFEYRYYSPAVERITGRPAEFFMAGPEKWMSTVHPEDRTRLAEISEQLISGRSASSENEHRIVLPDGTIRWVRAKVTVSPLVDGHRRVDGAVSDITVRKQAEEKLRETSAILRAVNEGTGNLICVKNRQDKVLAINPAMCRFLGKSESELIGQNDLDSLPNAEQVAQIRAHDRHIIETGITEQVEEVLDQADRRTHFLFTKSPYRNADGEVIGVIGIGTDITAQKRIEEALRQSEANLARAQSLAHLGNWSWDIQKDQLSWSDEMYRIYGVNRESFGHNLSAFVPLIHPQDMPRQMEAIKAAEAGRTFEPFEVRVVHPDGSLGVVQILGTEVERDASGRPKRIFGVSLDITERKRAEEELNEKAHLLSESQRIAHIGSWGWNLTGPINWTDETYRLYGISPETFTPTPESLVNLLHPEDRPAMQRWIEACRAGQSPDDLEFRVILPGGSVRILSGLGELMYDIENRPAYMAGTVQDITERKRVEEALRQAHDELEQRVQERTAELTKATEALRESETKYRTLVEELPAVTYISALDDTYTTLFISPQVKALLGFEPEDCEGDADFFARHVHPDDLKRVLAAAGHSRLSGEPFDCVYRMLHRSGEIVWVRDKAVVVRDEAGRPLFLQGVMLDVTEHQRAQRTLRLQSTALESAASGIVITDYDGRIIWANPAFAKLTGYELSEVVGKNPRFLNSGKHSKSFYQNLWRTVLSGRVWHGEIINKRKDGSLYDEEMTITPVPNAAGEITHFIAIKQDITESKSAEATRRHLAAIVESSGDAIFTGDFNGIVTSWNAGAERLYNYTPEEMLGRSVSILVPRDRKAELREMIKKLQGGEHIRHYETVRLKKGGIPVNVSIAVSPMKNAAGKVVGISAITRDITERKKLEQAVVEAGSREQRRIGQDLHDGLCQQLTGIGFLWKAINQREQVRALLDPATANDVSQLITKTIGEARDLARVLCPVELESNDFGVALKNLGLSMERLSAVSFVVRCQRPVLLADKTVATHLYRIAQEAISNAVRHGKATRVWIHLAWKKNRLTLRIKDNGSGFSTRRGLKEGIGMRSMRYRAHAIGGSVSIESQRGAGTTVVCVYTQPRSRIAGEARRRTPL